MDRRKWTTVEEIVANTRGGKKDILGAKTNEKGRNLSFYLYFFFLTFLYIYKKKKCIVKLKNNNFISEKKDVSNEMGVT